MKLKNCTPWKFSTDRLHAALKSLRKSVYPEKAPMEIAAWHVHGEPVSLERAMQADFTPFAVKDWWGGLWDTTWFRFRGEIPMEWAEREVVALIRLTDFEYEGFTAEGLIYQGGRARRAINANRREVAVSKSANGGESFEFFVEAAANGGADRLGLTQGMSLPDYHGTPRYQLVQAELACVDRAHFAYYYDFKTALEALDALPENSQRRHEIGRALTESLNLYEMSSGNIKTAREVLEEIFSKKNGDTVHTISAVGHAHIDTAWLWPLREAIRKCARSFSTALDYMEKYPEYHFACSQPQQYAWMKAYYPEIWEGIRAAVARGQWEPVGSMWVESDCNIPSGESLVRQLIYGKRFFRDEFGVDTRDVWLPDVFGYPGSLPQIFSRAGTEYFMTQKIGWSEINTFPHHTFYWEGIDGTRIFTHFPPVGNYASDTGPEDLIKACDNFRQHGNSAYSLLLYGYGDGGGGPSIEQLEKARRLQDFNGLPRLETGRAIDFFDRAAQEANDLPIWAGELYLENHRGTFTTHAAIKRENRRCEGLLHDAEFLDALSRVVAPNAPQEIAEVETAVYDVHQVDAIPAPDPHRDALRHAWKLLLLNQFHDILPGSSIHWVFEDSQRDYGTIRQLVQSVIDSALAAILSTIDTGEAKEPVVFFNTLGFERREILSLPNGKVQQMTLPAFGYCTIDQAICHQQEVKGEEGDVVAIHETSDGIILENGLLRLHFCSEGMLKEITDLRTQRSVLEPGQTGNQIHLHSDHPANYDAWNIDRDHRDLGIPLERAESMRIAEASPLMGTVEIVYRSGQLLLKQWIHLRAHSPRIDFETEVEWQETHQLLKVAFPVNVLSRRATYEIQFGYMERPTHFNNSWDLAMFESCAYRWADLSENGFGVSLLNDSKYGYDIHENVMRLSLLRSSTSPDPVADKGKHRFTYALLPHGGDFRQAGTVREAAKLNQPIFSRMIPPSQKSTQKISPATKGFFTCEAECIVLETIKRSEEGDFIVIRLYEAHGGRGSTRLRFAFPIHKAEWCDLLENPITLAPLSNGEVEFNYSPFEILTLKISLL